MAIGAIGSSSGSFGQPYNLQLQQTVFSSGTVNVPSGVPFVWAVLIGGGGGGNGSGGGAGGGAGATIKVMATSASSAKIGVQVSEMTVV